VKRRSSASKHAVAKSQRLRRCRRAFTFGSRGSFRWWTLHPRGANLLDLLQTLLFLVRPHGDELQHRLGYAQAAFAHLLSVLYGGPCGGGVVLHGGNQLVHVLLHQVRPHNEHYFVASLHVISESFVTRYLVVGIRYLGKSESLPQCTNYQLPGPKY